MTRPIRMGLLFLLVMFQLSVPVTLVVMRVSTLRHGKPLLFKTAPVDPYDAFHGRYVQLGFETSEVPAAEAEGWSHGQSGYLILEKDAQGYGKPLRLERRRPAPGEIFVKVRVLGFWEGKAHFQFPFDRFYLPEHWAPKAESLYRERAGAEDAHVSVRVKDGLAVLEELYLGGKPILEVLSNS